MLIRCEKCSTLYELDEKLLPRHGAPVQCSKCQHVFKAFPGSEQPVQQGVRVEVAPGAPPAGVGEDLVRESGTLASVPGPTRTTPRPIGGMGPGGPASAPPPRAASPRASVSLPEPDEPQFTADGRPIRKVPFPTAEPVPPGTRPVMVAPAGRSTAGSPSWLRWVVPVVLVVVVIAAAVLAWRLVGRRSQRSTEGGAAAMSPGSVPSALPPAGSAPAPSKK